MNNPTDAPLNTTIVRINEGTSCVDTRNACNPEGRILLKSRKRKLTLRIKTAATVTRIFFNSCNTSPQTAIRLIRRFSKSILPTFWSAAS